MGELKKKKGMYMLPNPELTGIAVERKWAGTTEGQREIELKPHLIKIPSACNLRFDILEHLVKHYDGEIHISLGMTSKEEEKKIVDFLIEHDRAKDTVLYACTSGYPVDAEDVCLLEIVRLKKEYGDTVKHIGFSGHHLGISLDIAAYTLGAEYIERHFTLNRAWKGTDHSASLEPETLRRLTHDLESVRKALTYKETDILPVEEVQRKKLKRI